RADEQDAAGLGGEEAALARHLDDGGPQRVPARVHDYNKRFGRAPRSAHDARPLRGDEDLSRIFSWQEERRMSRNLVVHFKRVSYLVEPGPETLRGQARARLRMGGRASRNPLRGPAASLCPSKRTAASTRMPF